MPTNTIHGKAMRLTLLALALLPAALHAQVTRDSVILVSSSRTTRLVPDRASLYVVVEGTAETAADAVARVQTKLKGVSDALRAFTARLEIDPPVAYSVGPTPPLNGYPIGPGPGTQLARTVIRVQGLRTDQVTNLITAVLGAGAASTSALIFESTVADSVRRVRLSEALTTAKADAESMAQALGGRLGALVDASSTSSPVFTQPTTLSFDSRFGSQSYAPEVNITVSVTMRYRLIR